ncbi:MAG: DUF4230 domain-containing protein [Anaerolineales bacterium]|nr:DUF4230 domain-containing protein [Anaerolineales bacterium]
MMSESHSKAAETQANYRSDTNGSCLRRVMYLFMSFFFLAATATLVIFIVGLFKVREGVQQLSENPVGEFVRQLVIPATPEILPSSAFVLRGIQDEARLITLSANYRETFIAQRNDDILWGALGEKLVFEAYGTVVAGIDLSQLGEGDLLVVAPQTVWVKLPQAEIFDDLPILDTELSYVADRDTGLLTRADPELETQVRRTAEQEILAIAQESDLLDRANVNAQQELREILEGLGFVEIIFFEDDLPPATPYVQEVPKGYVLTPEAPEN